MGDLQMALAKVPKPLWPLLMNAVEVGRLWKIGIPGIPGSVDWLLRLLVSSLKGYNKHQQTSYLDSVDVCNMNLSNQNESNASAESVIFHFQVQLFQDKKEHMYNMLGKSPPIFPC